MFWTFAVTTLADWIFEVRTFALNTLAIPVTVSAAVFVLRYTFKF